MELKRRESSTATILAWPARRNQSHNTYTKRLYDELESRSFIVKEFSAQKALMGRYDILHLHWPDGVLKTRNRSRAVVMTFLMVCVLGFVTRVRRKPIVWTVHNLRPHTSMYPYLWATISWVLSRTVTHLIHLSHAASDEMDRKLPQTVGLPRTVIHHGRYDGEYVAQNSRRSTRSSLKISESSYVFAFLGLVSEYKGALELAEAFSRLPADDEVTLIIAGACELDEYGNRIRKIAGLDSRIHFYPEYLSSARYADLAVASDVAVFPYRSILNSGSIFVPLELNRAVLAPALGSIPEMRRLVGEEWVLTYNDRLTTSDLQRHVGFMPKGKPRLDALEWRELAGQTAELYMSLLSRGYHNRHVGRRERLYRIKRVS